MTDTTAVTELHWSHSAGIFWPEDTDATTYLPCTTSDGQPAVLVLEDREREALGRALLGEDDDSDVADTSFFEPRRLYRRDRALFRCEAVAAFPAATEPRAFGYRGQAEGRPRWSTAVMSERAWRRGWQDITCPAHGYECTPAFPCDGEHR